ncbi:MAG TPA: hypothetical protein VF755_18490 [Catenuloplanes sp.]|jgi:hypothetical protein
MRTLPSNTSSEWDAVPFDDAEAESTRLGGGSLKGARGYATFRMPRRSLLKTAGVLGTALAISVISSVPERLLPKALARVGTQWTDCNIYSYDGIVCTGADYSPNYCGGDGWFLQYYGQTYSSWPVTRCNGRNAWWWYHYRQTFRCADGYRQYGSASPVFLICSWGL